MSECDHLGIYINMASMQIRRNLDSIIMKHSSISGLQGRVLCELAKAEASGSNIYQKDMERLFCSRRSSVNSLISALEQNGYLLRLPTKEDARLKKLVLTDLGRNANKNIQQIIDNYEASLASLYTPEEYPLLISMLKRITDNSRNL